jgi:heme/copper-type cytochrome/quinol oxidase subunit 4
MEGGEKMIAFIIAFIISAGMVIGIAWWLTDGFKF